MWWLVTLLVLALVSFLIVKSMKSSTQSKQIEHDAAQQDRLEQSANMQSASAADTSQQSSTAASTAVAGAAAETTRQAVTGGTSDLQNPTAASVSTGDTLSDVREMIKILNLDGPDAARLDVSREQLTALRKGDSSGIPDASSLENVATRLRRMLA